MGPLGPSMGSIERCKTVQKWMWYDPRERNPVEPRTSDVLPTSPRTHTAPGTAGYAITASRYNVLVKSTKIKGKNTRGYGNGKGAMRTFHKCLWIKNFPS